MPGRLAELLVNEVCSSVFFSLSGVRESPCFCKQSNAK